MSAEVIELCWLRFAREYRTKVRYDAEGRPYVECGSPNIRRRRITFTERARFTDERYGQRRDAALKGWKTRRAREGAER